MTLTYTNYPQVSQTIALRHWSEIRLLSLPEISKVCDSMTTSKMEFYPFSENRASDSHLQDFRRRVVELAAMHGFPNTTSSRTKVSFENALLSVLDESLDISAAEASNMNVWHFLNLFLLSDITLWRFGSLDQQAKKWSINEERIFTFNRNMIGRLWWRGAVLSPEIAAKLSEDEAVQILERPTTFAYPHFARAVGRRFASIPATDRHPLLLRHATKLFTRRMAVLSVYIMSDHQLDQFVDQVFGEAETHLREI